ncbi:GAF domain-containing protein [Streptomyces sp. NPDC050549]|uniref:GAF domain-containing protein n=1 Tax=Streptomyces sp. NPDC050549 TaxID=3155406 RepID=UPI003414E88D
MAPQLRLDDLLDDLQAQIARVRATQQRVHGLLEAVLAVGTDLDLAVVLRRVLQSAITLVDAEYGALGVLGEEGGLKQFVTVGMDEETVAATGHHPQGRGILGLLIREPRSLRLADLNAHPDATGFPAGHPPMHGFLGAPVRVREAVFGNLYLTDKRGGAGRSSTQTTRWCWRRWPPRPGWRSTTPACTTPPSAANAGCRPAAN